jgi:hypothetical protein
MKPYVKNPLVCIPLKVKYAKDLNETDFSEFVKKFGLGVESCTCHFCTNDNPGECHAKSKSPIGCIIDCIQPYSKQLKEFKDFNINMLLYLGIIGEKPFMGIVRELTPEMATIDILSFIDLEDGNLIIQSLIGNPRKGTSINYFFGDDLCQIFPIPAFLIKR